MSRPGVRGAPVGVAAGLLLLVACDQEPRALAPTFRPGAGQVLAERVVTDELGPRRFLVVGDAAGDDATLLSRLASATAADGWQSTKCITAQERCFRQPGLFVAMVGRSPVETAIQQKAAVLQGYSTVRPRRMPAEVLLIVQRGPDEVAPEPTGNDQR